MDQIPSELCSPLALAILELLDERPMHPYEMATTMRDRHHDEFIRLNFGTLYHTVGVLERKGWIFAVEREKEGRRPERTIYELTPGGREILTRSLGELLSQPVREYPRFVAGLMFMHHLDAAAAAHHLAERAAALHEQVTKLQMVLAELRARGLTRLSVIEVDHAIAMREAEHQWVRKLELEIAEGRLEWVVGIDSAIGKLKSGAHVASTH
jgi:DNA-binding PadR family transcriptional regulator